MNTKTTNLQGKKGSASTAAGIRQENRILRDALNKRVSQLTVLYQMGRDISENENWSDALDRFLMALVKYMQAEGAALLLFSRSESLLASRASFQIKNEILENIGKTLLDEWKEHARSSEIHSFEDYIDHRSSTCLERSEPWRISIIPLRHRSRFLGFLLVEKKYPGAASFEIDYPFLNTVQITFSEQVANAAYISELRHLSRFNHKILENMNSGVITTDLEGKVEFFNQRAGILVPDLRKREKIHFDSIFSSGNFSGEFFNKLISSDKNNYTLEVTALGKETVGFPARLSTSKMRDDHLNGEVIVAIFDDLTGQKAMEKEIRRNDRLRTLGQLSAGVAHEIRNPLTGIATSVEVLEGKLKGEEDKLKYIRAVLEEITRLDGIIKNLLDYARPSKPCLKDCRLNDLVRRVVNLLHEHVKRKGINLKITEKAAVSECCADSDQITQVLLNLTLNAVQACRKKDSIEIILHGEIVDGGKPFMHLEIIDSGPGIPEEIRSTLFEPFVTTKTRGTGMGLAISRQIIEEHGGRINCEFLQKGTKFTMLLPAVPAAGNNNMPLRSGKYVKMHPDS